MSMTNNVCTCEPCAGKMKRDAYNDDGPMMKRQRHPDDEVTFMIPSKVSACLNKWL